MKNGIDDKKRIIGTEAPTPYLFNVPGEFIGRFRKQISLINLLNEGTPDLIRELVHCCYQEEPTKFRDYTLYDIGAYPEPALSGKLTWRVTRPASEPKSEQERQQIDKLQRLMAHIKRKTEQKKGLDDMISGSEERS